MPALEGTLVKVDVVVVGSQTAERLAVTQRRSETVGSGRVIVVAGAAVEQVVVVYFVVISATVDAILK